MTGVGGIVALMDDVSSQEDRLFKANDGLEILLGFSRLTSSQKKSYLELHAYISDQVKTLAEQTGRTWDEISEMDRKILSVHATNSFEDGVFLFGSRFNHSCAPNVAFLYDSNMAKMSFRATSNIPTGEELNISYISLPDLPRSLRKEKLSHWGFICTCLACEDSPRSEQGERRRHELIRVACEP
ncbi:SET [Glarea lozoyensis ATCC 20868]|uniref:SET n=1 Tax=Glarea lozoyensis (strain ATCC 20868 / MF5171) TaxID=1116229 RepID=S3D3I2_GLAL2|nr:SET [Glarea lozoyensis ATCC 20868]EPE26626.1 SET [Glarea lozoyensis ATCC 20868]